MARIHEAEEAAMPENIFSTHRSLLFTVAYEMLGSAADAEDVVQEAWLRWADADHEAVLDARAYLVRIVTRLALDRLRALRRQRETYVGEWLPEPVVTTPDVADDLELAESISFAMLTVLETLAPTERAVFVLREVFGVPYDEVAKAVGKTPAAVRQIAHRARERVAARRPRMQVQRAEQQAAVESLRIAIDAGDLQALMDVLAPEVVLVADGGGVASAVLRPIQGATRVARLLAGLTRVAPGVQLAAAWINGMPAIRIERDGVLDTAVSLTVEEGGITGIYAIRNPKKLGRLGEVVQLSRASSRPPSA